MTELWIIGYLVAGLVTSILFVYLNSDIYFFRREQDLAAGALDFYVAGLAYLFWPIVWVFIILLIPGYLSYRIVKWVKNDK